MRTRFPRGSWNCSLPGATTSTTAGRQKRYRIRRPSRSRSSPSRHTPPSTRRNIWPAPCSSTTRITADRTWSFKCCGQPPGQCVVATRSSKARASVTHAFVSTIAGAASTSMSVRSSQASSMSPTLGSWCRTRYPSFPQDPRAAASTSCKKMRRGSKCSRARRAFCGWSFHVPRMPADLVPYRSTEACFFADERRTFFVVPGRYAPSAFQRQAIERWQTQNASGGLANDVEFSYPMNAIQADTSPEYHATSVAADGMAASSRSAGNDGSVGGFAADWSAPGWLQPGFLDDRPSTGGMLMPDDPRQFEKIDHPSQKLETRYEFRVFYHPYACELLRRVKRYGIDGLLTWPLD